MATYYRGSQSPDNPVNPGLDWSMWTTNRADAEFYASAESGALWSVSQSDVDIVLDVADVQKQVMACLVHDYETGRLPYGVECLINPQDDIDEQCDQIVDELNPDAIVTSAGAWDNQDVVAYIWDRILEPIWQEGQSIMVTTRDGAILMGGDARWLRLRVVE